MSADPNHRPSLPRIRSAEEADAEIDALKKSRKVQFWINIALVIVVAGLSGRISTLEALEYRRFQ